MSVEIVRAPGREGIDIAYERFGDPSAPPMLLVMGLGTQMLGWPDEFCASLVERGLHVIRFDNRDIGLSTHLHDAPPPDVMAALQGDTSSASYTLSDMAADAVALLDALGIDSAHIVGASMGGMIAQAIAIEHADHVRSLTSIMSSTGDRTVGQATPEALTTLLLPPATSREEAIDRTLAIFRVIGSPGFPLDEDELRRRAGLSYDRAYDPVGVARQLLGVLASPDRTEGLRSLDVPTLVVHGAEDPLVQVSGGHATAAAVPHADLAVFDGMGHDLPRALWGEIVQRIAAVVDRGERARGRPDGSRRHSAQRFGGFDRA
jgi:pimeloyl-ACP methyl ester carboxylesterase